MLLSAPWYAQRNRMSTFALAGTVLALTAIAVATVVESSGRTMGIPLLLAIGLFLAGLTAWLWREPVRGLYVLVAAAVVQETQLAASVYPDDIGGNIYFFEDMATWTHIKGISVSLGELFMMMVLLIWVLKAIAQRGAHFDRGSLMRPLGLYMAAVLFAEFHGLTSGGSFRLSLWEVRSQVYMLIGYVLVCNLVTKRSQVLTLIWILLLGTGLKAIQGIYRDHVSLNGNLTGVESLFPHEQSFFFNIVILFGGVALLYGASRRMKQVLLVVVPLCLYADALNQRRVATLALVVGLLVLLVITAIVHAPSRRIAVCTLLALAAVLPPYYAYYQNKSGTLAEPARAIASNFHPNARDASSNLYRRNEDADIVATVKSSLTTTAIGYGFGKPMLTPYPLADISQTYIFWNIMPHNSILWIWMRLGTLGYALFWFLIVSALVQALRLARRVYDFKLRGLALFIVLCIFQEIIFGYLDLQWTNYRNLIFMGVLFALLSRLSSLGGENRDPVRQPILSETRHIPAKRSALRSSLGVMSGDFRI